MNSPNIANMRTKNILERLDAGEVVIGDGGFVFAMEKRGYVKAGPWTPEVCVEHPEAVRQLHREFLRSGSDVMQAFTFYASDDKLKNRGHIKQAEGDAPLTCKGINAAACKLAMEVASEGDAMALGGLCQTPTYLSGKGKEATQQEFRNQVEVFVEQGVDFLLCEYFEHVEEAEWAIEVCKETSLPVACNLCIGPEGDLHGVSTEECGVRMVKAGADIVGINCHFDPFVTIEAVKLIKKGVEAAGLKAHYMAQPLAYHTPDASKQGFIDLPEFPFALEPRICTRWDMHRYAREAYEAGIRYIGGCCGFEPYHIRAIAEELEKERGRLCEASTKHGKWGDGLRLHTKPWVRARARQMYWSNLKPASGRPMSAAMSKPDCWGCTAGHAELMQKQDTTTDEELAVLQRKREVGDI